MKSKNLKEFSNSHFLKFMKLRSIDILLVSAELKQARLCFQLGRMFSRMVSWEEKSGATLLPLRRYCQ